MSDTRITPEGRARLLQAADDIVADAEHFDMKAYIGTSCTKAVGYDAHGALMAEVCGTTCCIAGAVVLRDRRETLESLVKKLPRLMAFRTREGGPAVLDTVVTYEVGKILDLDDWFSTACRLLFTPEARNLGFTLFFVDAWPRRFQRRYNACGEDMPYHRALVAREFIEYFVETDGYVLDEESYDDTDEPAAAFDGDDDTEGDVTHGL